jgi:mannose-6-phosphate isomerase-like protein (cupin superfamily)
MSTTTRGGIEEVRFGDDLYAIIISRDFSAPGIHFVTPNDYSQQLAYMRHPAGKVIPPHVHNSVVREVKYTLEVLFVKKGRVRVDFYDTARSYLESRVLEAGDVILLASGGHGFEALEELEMIEVKQGPYAGDADKTRFAGISSREAKINKIE